MILFRDILENTVPSKLFTFCEYYEMFEKENKKQLNWNKLKMNYFSLLSQKKKSSKNKAERIIDSNNAKSVNFWFNLVFKYPNMLFLLKKSFRIFIIKKLIMNNQTQLKIQLKKHHKNHKKFREQDTEELFIPEMSKEQSTLLNVLPMTNIFQSKYKNTQILQRQKKNTVFMNKIHKICYLEDRPKVAEGPLKLKKIQKDVFKKNKKDANQLEFIEYDDAIPKANFEKQKSEIPIVIEEGFAGNLINKGNIKSPIKSDYFKKKQLKSPEMNSKLLTVFENVNDKLPKLSYSKNPFERQNFFLEEKQKLKESSSINEEEAEASHEDRFRVHQFFLKKKGKNDLEKNILNFIKLDKKISETIKNIRIIIKTLADVYSQHRLRLSDPVNLRFILSILYYQDNNILTKTLFEFLEKVINFNREKSNYSSLVK